MCDNEFTAHDQVERKYIRRGTNGYVNDHDRDNAIDAEDLKRLQDTPVAVDGADFLDDIEPKFWCGKPVWMLQALRLCMFQFSLNVAEFIFYLEDTGATRATGATLSFD